MTNPYTHPSPVTMVPGSQPVDELIAAQAAKIAELEEEVKTWKDQHTSSVDACNDLKIQLSNAQDEIAKLKPDAERIDWLLFNCLRAVTVSADSIPMNRAAIDAARNAK